MELTDDIASSPYSWMADQPELRPIFDQYVSQGRTADWLKAQIEKTEWWKHNSAAARQWEDLLHTDPSEAESRFQSTRSEVEVIAARIGSFDGAAVDEVAKMAVQFGWNDQQIKNALSRHARPTGDIRAYMQNVKDTAAEYLMPYSDDAAFELAKSMFLGKVTPEGMRASMREVAKANYPSLSGLLDQGFTMRQITDPMKQAFANTMEVGAETVDLINNPKYAKMVHYVDPTTNAQRPMTITEATQYARSQSDWGKTFGARNEADQATRGLLQTFGQGGF